MMQSTREPDWLHAITLAERLATPPCEDGAAQADAERRLAAWRSQPPFDRASSFERRLALDSLTEADLRRLLGEPMQALQNRIGEPPWLTSLRAVLALPFDGRLSALLPERLKEKPTTGFLVAADRFVERAVARLEKRAADLARTSASRLFEPAAVAKIFFPDLADALLDALGQVMVLELNIARLEGELEGSTAEERFQSFLTRLHDPECVAALFGRYPVLARLVVEQVDRWAEVKLELLERLCCDEALLREAFGRDGDLGQLTGATGGLADSHRGGRSVVILKFSSGIRIVYKPKSLAIDLHFQQLLGWLNERGVQPAFRPMTVLDRGAYGWTEFIASKECENEEEVRRFYERQGAYLALLYVLDATDFHADNVIACGEHPLLIDLEALLHPHRSRPPVEGASRVARRAIWSSVLNIGLLPERVWSNTEHDGVDISGLGTPEGQVTPHLLPQWEAAGTDTMHLVRRQKSIGGRKNRPKLAGSPVNVLDYRQAILDGFDATYATLATHRDELLDEQGPLARFQGDEVSVFLRSSRTYRRLLRESYHPDVLHDALDRDRLFDLLWIEVESQPQLLNVIRAEREDLLRGDIPAFGARPGSRDLWTSAGEIVPDFFSEASMSVVHRRLRNLGEEDFARQRWFVDASLSTFSNDVTGEESRYPAAHPRGGVDRDRLLEAALSVGNRLEAIAVRGQTDVSWIGVNLDRDRAWSIEPTGLDLYGGVPGIALFLAYLGRVTGKDDHLPLARAALATIEAQSEERRRSIKQIGAFDGWGGLIYIFTHLGVLWNRDDLIGRAETLVGDLPDLIGQDDLFDVAGGAAGCIAALRCLYRTAPSDRITAVAIQCGDHLLARGEAMESGIGWRPKFVGRRPLAGFANGAGGIAWALLDLSAWTGLERFRAAAFAAWAYERSLFVEETGNWQDLRERGTRAGASANGRSGGPTAWCHGAPGIGLARLRSLDLADDPDVRAEIAAALETTLRDGFGRNHSLCHGDLGNLELLLQAQRVLGGSWQPHIERLTATVLDSIEAGGWRSGIPYGVETPGLMAGLAGIGYGLLRMAEPERVPSVLVLDSPCLERSRVG